MPLDGSLPQREEISWPKMGILKWPLTIPAGQKLFFHEVQGCGKSEVNENGVDKGSNADC